MCWVLRCTHGGTHSLCGRATCTRSFQEDMEFTARSEEKMCWRRGEEGPGPGSSHRRLLPPPAPPTQLLLWLHLSESGSPGGWDSWGHFNLEQTEKSKTPKLLSGRNGPRMQASHTQLHGQPPVPRIEPCLPHGAEAKAASPTLGQVG